MVESRDEFAKRLLDTFKAEAREHIDGLSSGLRKLENEEISAGARQEILETIFREAHSLKGAARAVNQTEMESYCQSMESVFSALKRGDASLSAPLLGLLQKGVDSLAERLFAPDAARGPAAARAREYRARIESVLTGTLLPPDFVAGESFPSASTGDATPGMSETVRIPAERLHTILVQAEELLSSKISAMERGRELRDILLEFAAWRREWEKIVPVVQRHSRRERSDPATGGNGKDEFTEFLGWTYSFWAKVERCLAAHAKASDQDLRSLAGMADDLLEDARRALMIPSGQLLEAFPRFVRNLSGEQGKEVEFVVHGEDVEMERRILEEMKDPLLHLLRNAVDHGIEDPSARLRKNKTRRGRIELSIRQRGGNKAEILVADDGAGIDLAKVQASARKLGILGGDDAGDRNDADGLLHIFRSGVSSSPIITDVSGRGLGLAIVREKVEKLDGTVAVETRPDQGTTFRLVVPLAHTQFRGVLVRAAARTFVIPTANVLRVTRVKRDEIRTVEQRPTIRLDGKAVSLVRLSDALGIFPSRSPDASGDYVQAVVLGSAERQIAFLVDEVISEEEVLVKGLGRQLARVRNIAGASMSRTAGIVPVLYVPDLMESAVREVGAGRSPSVPEPSSAEGKGRSVLVVEDSITSRTLLKNILEGAGYDVVTAVDGVDGLTQLRAGKFDLVVSDVDMPRMNGFDLTANIRADKRLAELPVVLVTALESRDDKERGIEAGANAYIVKSQFHQNNLLEAVERLL
jgi:two-component system, chemotaxis family, sensor kinase CheA